MGGSLLQWGEFTSHSGLCLSFKVECEALTDADWECVVKVIASAVMFHAVEGVPRGGMKLAKKLRPYAQSRGGLLIVDDVLTTGDSMEEHRAGRPALGVVLFARGPCPSWVQPIFRLNHKFAGVE